MSELLAVVIAAGTLAFGAVYPWGYLPLFAIAACIGVAGLIRRRGIPADVRTLAIGLALVAVALVGQLVPLPRTALDIVSPNAASVLSRYSLSFAGGASNHPLSLNPNATGLALVGLAALALFLMGLPNLLSRRDLIVLPRYLIVLAVLLALAGIFGREHNNGLVFGFWHPERGGVDSFGPFVNRNHFAGWMVMASCLAIGGLCARLELAFKAVKPGLRNRVIWLSTPEANRLILVGASIAVMAISLVWTMSRSGIASFAFALGCFGWLVARRRDVGRTKRIVVVAALGVLLLLSVSWRGLGAILRWYGNTTDVFSRLDAWRDGWQVVRQFPLAGVGLNAYSDAMIFYQKHVLDVWMTYAHNDYLQLLAEGGVLVAIPVAVVGLLLALSIRRRLSEARADSYDYWVRAGACVGLLAIGLQETVEFSLRMPANAFLFATLAAVAISPPRQSTGRLARGR